MKTKSDLFAPSSTIFRVRRKRGADPLAGLVVLSSKRQRTDKLAAAAVATDGAAGETGEKHAREIFFPHVGTSSAPSGKDAAQFLDREHKVVEMVDYDPDGNQVGRRKITVLDRQYLEVMEAAKAISNFGIEEQERRDFERDSTAPLAAAELDEEDDEQPSSSAGSYCDYVYDFYYAADGRTSAMSVDRDEDRGYEVRLPTDEELQLYFGGDDESGSDGLAADDDEDSNDENYYGNDYPDEDDDEEQEFGADEDDRANDDYENDTTSDDDSYDHYGEEKEDYGGICHDSDIDSDDPTNLPV